MQKIIIKNFRQIKHADIEIKQFLCLIGEQASGKSTIAKLIYFFKTIKDKLITLLVMSSDFDTIFSTLCLDIQKSFVEYFGKQNQIFSLVFEYSTKNNITIKGSDIIEISISKGLKNTMEKEIKQFFSEFQKYKNIPDAYEQKSKSAFKTAELIFSESNNLLFMPAGRQITVSYLEAFQQYFYSWIDRIDKSDTNIDVKILTKFMEYSKRLADYYKRNNGFESINQEDSIYKVLNKYILEILHGKYDSEGYEKIVFSESNESVPLNSASSGQQESIRIIQDAIYVLNNKLSVSRIIEEPEAHLFPTAQKLLIQLLVLIANKTNSNLIITTHSPNILATFNTSVYYSNVVKKYPNKISEIEEHFQTFNNYPNIEPENLSAYSLNLNSPNYCVSLIDKSTLLIGDNTLDSCAEQIFDDFDYLYSIED